MRFDSQFSRMTSQRFSTGLSSGDFGGSGRMVIFVGTTPGVLSGKQPLVASIDGYITLGGEDEAADYVDENGQAWQATPGAVVWVAEVTRKLKPRRRRN